MNIKTVEDKVRKVLLAHPASRDDDMILYSCILTNVYGKKLLEEMSGWEMLNRIYHSKVPHLTSVLRCRQQLQKMDPMLRGPKYKERHQRAEIVKEEIKTWPKEEQPTLNLE